MALIPKLGHVYDEPFADSSQLPTLLVSELARKHVSVALSGDGGDELFGGYVRYQWGQAFGAASRWIPMAARQWLARCADWAGHAAHQAPGLRAGDRFHFGHRLRHLGQVIRAESPDELYRALVSRWGTPEAAVPCCVEPLVPMWEAGPITGIRERMMLLDTVNYLPDDILVKLDRASMAVGLEARVPLLDPELLRFAWRLPANYKFRHRRGKWILQRLLTRYLPKRLVDRPKMGFAIPLDDWLRGPMREWASSLIESSRLGEDGILDPAPVRMKWQEHLAGGHNGHRYLWTILMFQAWRENARQQVRQAERTRAAR